LRTLTFLIVVLLLGQLVQADVSLERRGTIVIAGRQRRLCQNIARPEIGLMPIGKPDPVSARLHLGHRGQSELQVQVRGVLEPLARAQIERLGILTALAQPQRVDGEAIVLRQLDGELVRGGDFQA